MYILLILLEERLTIKPKFYENFLLVVNAIGDILKFGRQVLIYLTLINSHIQKCTFLYNHILCFAEKHNTFITHQQLKWKNFQISIRSGLIIYFIRLQ